MKKKILILPLIALSLASCSKTEHLYGQDEYNHPEFNLNYYLDRSAADELDKKLNSTNEALAWNLQSRNDVDALAEYNPQKYVWKSDINDEMFGYHYNLDKIDKAFNYGILSKLYDGRVRCDGLFQKSRVQLNKTGYSTYFNDKTLLDADYFAFACRGGTTVKNPLKLDLEHGLKMNFTVSFYKHITNSSLYDRVDYHLNNVPVQTDNGGNTNLISFEIDKRANVHLNGAVAMSLSWECVDERMESFNLSDDYTNKEKDHLAIMLYEVFIGNSIWR